MYHLFYQMLQTDTIIVKVMYRDANYTIFSMDAITKSKSFIICSYAHMLPSYVAKIIE